MKTDWEHEKLAEDLAQMKECPYCGSEEYYIKQSFKGTCHYRIRFDGKESDNGEMWDNADFKTTSKYAWCSNCNKRLFELDEDMNCR